MIVYHGSSEVVRQPDILHSYRALDFGKGFLCNHGQGAGRTLGTAQGCTGWYCAGWSRGGGQQTHRQSISDG